MFGHAKKHLMWFPFLLVAMTVILAIVIVVIDKNRSESFEEIADVITVVEQVDPAITDEEYQGAVQRVLVPLWDQVDASEGDADAVIAVRDALLAMRVSSGARDIHIQLVAAANQLTKGLHGDPIALADAQVRLTHLQKTVLWLR